MFSPLKMVIAFLVNKQTKKYLKNDYITIIHILEKRKFTKINRIENAS